MNNKKRGSKHKEINEHDRVVEHEKRFDPDKWIKDYELKRKMNNLSESSIDPSKIYIDSLGKTKKCIFINENINPKNKVVITSTQNPQKYKDFGMTNEFFEIKTKDIDINGTLVIKFNPNKLDQISKESLRIFHWIPDTKEFDIVTNSQYSMDGNYVYGQINSPGIYTLIGIINNPIIIHTLKTLCSIKPLTDILSNDVSTKIKNNLLNIFLDEQVKESIISPDILDILKDRIDSNSYPVSRSKSHNSLTTDKIRKTYATYTQYHNRKFPWESILCPESYVESYSWESLGPNNISGCIRHIILDPTNTDIIYAAANNGGVWKLNSITRYPNNIWIPLTDTLKSLQMNTIEIADDQTLYIANRLGEVYRSIDQGNSWTYKNNLNSMNIRKILILPGNSDIIYVAVDKKLLKSIDGGEEFDIIFENNNDILDVVMDPTNHRILYMAERNIGIRKNSNGGNGTWNIILPWSRANRPVSTRIVIALGYRNMNGSLQSTNTRTVAVKFGNEVFINNNGGAINDWISLGKRGGNGYGDWCHVIAIDPFNPNIILAGQQELFRYDGDNWSQVIGPQGPPHEDQHSIVFDPYNQNIVYLSNDGGVFRSSDGGITWYKPPGYNIQSEIKQKRSLVSGLNTTEFFRVAVRHNQAIGTMFHSGLIATPDLTKKLWRGISGHAWEWHYTFPDPKRVYRYYVFNPDGSGSFRVVFYDGVNVSDPLRIGNFKPYISGSNTSNPIGAITIDKRINSNILLVGTDRMNNGKYSLLKTTQANFQIIRNNQTYRISPMPTWIKELESNTPIVSVVFDKPGASGKVYAISSDGKLYCKNEINNNDPWNTLGRWNVSDIRQLISNATSGIKLYAISSTKFGYFDGRNWSTVHSTSLPQSEFNSIAIHPRDTRIVFLGTDSGVYLSYNNGLDWSPFDSGLPNAEILQIFQDYGYLYAVSHGRGLWRRRIIS